MQNSIVWLARMGKNIWGLCRCYAHTSISIMFAADQFVMFRFYCVVLHHRMACAVYGKSCIFWGFYGCISMILPQRIAESDRKWVGDRDRKGLGNDLRSDSNPGSQIYGTAPKHTEPWCADNLIKVFLCHYSNKLMTGGTRKQIIIIIFR